MAHRAFAMTMDISRYYDPVLNRVLTPLDGCSWGAWVSGASARFAIHPDGFPVFVPTIQMETGDEYFDGDPYAVDSSPFHQRRFQQTLELISSAVPGDGGGLNIIDCGCGEGHITQAIHQQLPNSIVSAFDYSLSAIRIAHRRCPSIEFAVADAYYIPYAPASVDIAVMNNLWEHLPDPMRALAQIHRVLKLNGFVVLSTPSRYRFSNLARVLFGRPVVFMSQYHVTEYTVGQVIEQLRYGGFEVVEAKCPPIGDAGPVRSAAKAALRWWLGLVKSHHNLESTVFYLGQKTRGTN